MRSLNPSGTQTRIFRVDNVNTMPYDDPTLRQQLCCSMLEISESLSPTRKCFNNLHDSKCQFILRGLATYTFTLTNLTSARQDVGHVFNIRTSALRTRLRWLLYGHSTSWYQRCLSRFVPRNVHGILVLVYLCRHVLGAFYVVWCPRYFFFSAQSFPSCGHFTEISLWNDTTNLYSRHNDINQPTPAVYLLIINHQSVSSSVRDREDIAGPRICSSQEWG